MYFVIFGDNAGKIILSHEKRLKEKILKLKMYNYSKF